MKITSLKLLVDRHDIKKVICFDGMEFSFHVPSDAYEERMLWLVKGEYEIVHDHTIDGNVLKCKKLEKDLNISIKPVGVHTISPVAPSDPRLEEFANMPVTVLVYQKYTGKYSMKDTKRRFVRQYAEACVMNAGGVSDDFAVFEIDWQNRHIAVSNLDHQL